MPYSDPEQQRKAQREYAQRRRVRDRELLASYKKVTRDYIRGHKDRPCADCKGTFPVVCMDFDHVRGEKIMNLSRMHNQWCKRERIDAEIAKCDVVCANCHRIRTAERDGWDEV